MKLLLSCSGSPKSVSYRPERHNLKLSALFCHMLTAKLVVEPECAACAGSLPVRAAAGMCHGLEVCIRGHGASAQPRGQPPILCGARKGQPRGAGRPNIQARTPPTFEGANEDEGLFLDHF